MNSKTNAGLTNAIKNEIKDLNLALINIISLMKKAMINAKINNNQYGIPHL